MRKRSLKEWLLLVARATIRATSFMSSYICLSGMLLLVISDPILRYAIGSPLYWSNEVSTFLMVEMALFGFAIAFARGGHVRVTLIFNKLPHRAQNVLWVIISLLALCFSGLIAYSVMKLALSSLKHSAVSGTAALPFFPWQIAATVGLIVFFVAVLIFTIRAIAIALGKIREEEGGKELTIVGF